ncbi:MAG: site-specific integrase [Anaerostipes sp.]|nr:site-specific integrase [Anaerostipes sp.]
MPRIDVKKVEVFNSEEQKKLIEYLFNHKNNLNMGFLLALFTGIRIGELCALKYFDLQLDTGILIINKTMQRIINLDDSLESKTKIIIDSPKSMNSIRSLPIPSILKPLIKTLSGERQNTYILTGTEQFIEPRLLQYKFKDLLMKCELKDSNFHTLRHTFATNCIQKRHRY